MSDLLPDDSPDSIDMQITLDMISAGVAAYNEFVPENEEPEALVFAIISRALRIAQRNKAIRSAVARSTAFGELER